jgi:N-ethylmaleimide reductase
LEQFLRDSTNKRADAYGGPLENRARLLLEVVSAVVFAAQPGRVGVRLSPLSTVNDIGLDSSPAATYGYVIDQLNKLNLAYVHVIEGITHGPRQVPGGFDLRALRHRFVGTYIANNGYDRELALEARRRNLADLIAFGRLFISNPDLVERLRLRAPLNVPDQGTFFGGGAQGYTDYPIFANPGP